MRTIFSQTKKEDLFPDQLGDYELISLFIESSRDDKGVGIKFKQYALDLVYTNISIYEDIYSNCLTGSVTILDGNHLLTDFPIIGEETIEMCFRSLNSPISIQQRMRVTGVSELSYINENTILYTLFLTSDVAIRSEKQKISKSFYAGRTSQVVEYICARYLKMINDNSIEFKQQGDYFVKPKDKFSNYYSIETDSGHVEKYISPNYSPFRIINKLCRRTVSTTGSLFFFFQDINKFRFVSLEDIFKKRATETSIKKLVYVPKDTVNKDTTTSWNIVNEYKILSRFDVFKNMSKGMYSSEYLFLDVEKKEFRTKQFYYQRDAKNYYHVNDKQYLLSTNNSDITHDERRENPRTVKEVVMFQQGDQESQNYSSHFSEGLQRRLSIQAQLDSMILQIVLPGDSSGYISIGDIVEFVFPKYQRDEGDSYLSGRYLVTRIHHSISTGHDKYRIILEVTSDTISNGYNLIEGDDSTKIGIQTDSKDIVLEPDRDVVGTSVTSLLTIDEYNQEARKRRLEFLSSRFD